MRRVRTAVLVTALLVVPPAGAVPTSRLVTSLADTLSSAMPKPAVRTLSADSDRTASVQFAATLATPLRSGAVGAYQFSIAARTGQSVSCSFDGTTLVRITERSPLAKMRTYWTRPHNGLIADAQNVGFYATLYGEHGGHWRALATLHRFALVGKSWKRLPTLPAFTGVRSTRYDQFRLHETLRWMRPTDNRQEGSVTVNMTHYRDGDSWRSSCVRAHPKITTTTLATATLGKTYAYRLHAAGVAPFRWSMSPTSVRGLKLSTTGLLSGTAKLPATAYTVSVRSRDANGLSTTRKLRLHLRYVAGDVNGDARVTCTDLSIIDKYWGIGTTHGTGDLTADGKVDAADEAAFKAHHASACAISGVSVDAQPVSGDTKVTWTVTINRHGGPLHVHASNDHGGSWDWDTGVTPWTSTTVTDDVGDWNTADDITVVVTRDGQQVATAGASQRTQHDPAPAPGIGVSAGLADTTDCPATTCNYFHLSFTNFPTGTYTVDCNKGGQNDVEQDSIDVTSANFEVDSTTCFAESQSADMPVSVTVVGVHYDGQTSDLPSQTASW